MSKTVEYQGKLIDVPDVKENDIVRYPSGWTLLVRKVYKDENGDLYVKQLVFGKDYPRYIL